jgi:hypothetical protein
MPVAAVIATMPTVRPYVGRTWAFTVDFTKGLRLYPQDETGAVTAEYGALTFVDTPAASAVGGMVTEPLTYGVEAAGARAVFVQGTGVSALVQDGSGKIGPVSFVTEESITTTAAATNYARAKLAEYRVPVRGTVGQQAFNDPGSIHPGSSVIITDARAGMTGTGRIILSIRKGYLPGALQSWTVAFGGTQPTLTELTRKLALNPRSS